MGAQRQIGLSPGQIHIADTRDQLEPKQRVALEELREHTRIDARIKILRSEDTPQEIIAGQSGPTADLVLLGMGDDGHTASGAWRVRAAQPRGFGRFWSTVEPPCPGLQMKLRALLLARRGHPEGE